MGGTYSTVSIVTHVKDAFCDIRKAYNSNKMRPNPTLEALLLPHTQGQSSKCHWQKRIDARETLRRSRREQQRIEEERESARDMAFEADRAIRPITMPTMQDFMAAKQCLQYEVDFIHFGIAGIAGSGKSLLLEAFLRGNCRVGAAPTRISRTVQVARYADGDLGNPFVWYELFSGEAHAGPEWKWFTDEGFYLFDAIFVLFDIALTQTDMTILKNCERFNIPAYIVRMKANERVSNTMLDFFASPNSARARRATAGLEPALWRKARNSYIQNTRALVRKALEDDGLPERRVYVIEGDVLCGIIRGEGSELGQESFDEWELLNRVLYDARRRRVTL